MNFKHIALAFLLLVLVKSTVINNTKTIQTERFSDPFCAIFDQQTGECQACICRAYFDKNRKCQPIDDLCQTWNINTGQCTSCYKGYELKENLCVSIKFYNPGNESTKVIENPNCLTDDGNGTCLTCRPYYILYCGDCQTTGENPFCAKFNSDNICVECDPDADLDVNNVCQRTKLTDDNNTCSQFDNCLECNDTECTKCEDNYRQEYISKKCVLPTDNCKQGCALCSSDECFACEAGYSAQSWPICIDCSYMYSRNSKGECVAILSDCSAFDNCKFCVMGECSMCNDGYKLNDKLECIKQ